MTDSLTFFVPGDPRGKGVIQGSGRQRFHDPKTANYLAICTLFAQRAKSGARWETADGPVMVTLLASIDRPARLVPNPKGRKQQPPDAAFWAPCKPDPDNIAKAVCDAMTRAGIYSDDSRIVRLVVEKRYVAIGADVGVLVMVERLPTWDQP